MNREIKFRFWIEKIKEMGTWETALKECDRLSLFNLEGWIPMQYTGLKDKSGKEIYEGDIVRIYEETNYGYAGIQRNLKTAKIIYEDEKAGYLAKWEYSSKCQEYVRLNCDNTFDCEVIGNIFENPELLENKL
jgi:uncharacterized phage protein (TIGR01671 family)